MKRRQIAITAITTLPCHPLDDIYTKRRNARLAIFSKGSSNRTLRQATSMASEDRPRSSGC